MEIYELPIPMVKPDEYILKRIKKTTPILLYAVYVLLAPVTCL